MKKNLYVVIPLIFCALLAITLTASGYLKTNSENKDISIKTAGQEAAGNDSRTRLLENILSFQGILNDYTKKLQEATAVLIEEYEKEASENQNGLSGLEIIYNEKIASLSVICTEGFSEMATFHFENGSSLYSEYEEWAAKLEKVYIQESAKITDAYMKSENS